MRIVNFTNSYRPVIGGIETSIILFRRGLIEAGHEVFVVAPEYHDYEDEEPYIFRFPSLQIPRQLVDASVALAPKEDVAMLVRGLRPHVIHTQHPFLIGALAADIALDLKLPLVYTFHSRYDNFAESYVPIPLASDLANLVIDEMVGRFLEKCSHLVAPTPSIRDYILETYNLDVPVTVVPTPVDLSAYTNLKPERIRQQLGAETAELLLYIGRFAPEKNLNFLLKAFARIAAARPHARLLLVGRGPEEDRLHKLAQQLNITERVIFAGPVAHDDIPHYAAAADLFVFASTLETQGLVLVEAMAAGTPVVAIKTPGPADVLADGGGVLVPLQENAFVEAVVSLLADRDRFMAMKSQARQAAQRYSIATTTEQLVAVYEACQ
jgi:glycosyltransferase involved in cell wall biosynthesis